MKFLFKDFFLIHLFDFESSKKSPFVIDAFPRFGRLTRLSFPCHTQKWLTAKKNKFQSISYLDKSRHVYWTFSIFRINVACRFIQDGRQSGYSKKCTSIQLPSAIPATAPGMFGCLVEWLMVGRMADQLLGCWVPTSSKMGPKRIARRSPDHPKTDQVGPQIHSKIHQNGSQNRPKSLPGGLLEGSGEVLGPSWPQDGPKVAPRGPKTSKKQFWGALLGGKLEAKID